MNTTQSDKQDGQEALRRRDDAVREQFPVIVDFNRRIEKLEQKFDRLRDLTILNTAVGLGIALGQLVENFHDSSWGWPAATTCGVTILVVAVFVRSRLK